MLIVHPKRVSLLFTSLALTAALLAPGAVLAQDATEDATADFRTAVTEARDAAQAAIDRAIEAIEAGGAFVAAEAALMGPVAENLPLMAEQVAGYADRLEAFDVPETFAGDVALHVETLREIAANLEKAAAAAEVADDAVVTESGDLNAEALARLAAGLSPGYAEMAFVSVFPDVEFVALFGGSTEEELAYLSGVADARDEFGARNADFGRALRGSYSSPEDLLRALYEAGAGTAFAAVEEKALTLEPPVRFQDEHVWWLSRAAELSRLDGLIGEAARGGDVVGFLANNIRLGLVAGPYPDLDPAFGSAVQPGSSLGVRLDPAAPISRTAYGVALFDALRAAVSHPLDVASAFDMPGAQLETSMQAVSETGDELLAALADLRLAVEGLTAPDEYTADQQLILEFLDTEGSTLEELIAASTAGDGDSIFASLEARRVNYCSTAASLSDAVGPAADVYFDTGPDICR